MGSDGINSMYHPQVKGLYPMTEVDVTTNGNVDTDAVTADAVPDVLSPRQRTVYDMHKKGDKNTEIAVALGIAPGTVSNALVAAKTRLGEVAPTNMGDVPITQMLASRREGVTSRITQMYEDITKLEVELTQIDGIIASLGDES